MREVHMKRVPHRQPVVPAATALFVAAFGLISPANAQTFSSSYTSTAPKDTVPKVRYTRGLVRGARSQSGTSAALSL